MELTPLDVRKKKDDLRKAVRGYDIAQVDSFLDLAAERLEEVVQENRTLRERINGLNQQLQSYKERENALNEALLTAQELREEARAQARRESDLKLKEAEVRANRLVEEAERSVQSSVGRMEELRSRRRHFLESFRDTLRRYMEELDVEEQRLSAELAARESAERGPGTSADPVSGEGARSVSKGSRPESGKGGKPESGKGAKPESGKGAASATGKRSQPAGVAAGSSRDSEAE